MPRAKYVDYKDAYRYAKLERHDGILEVTLHTNGGPVVWDGRIHHQLGYLFADIAADPDNRIVIITGTGDSFIETENAGHDLGLNAVNWEDVTSHARRLTLGQLEVRAPMIAAINGPAAVHAEIGVMCDIVLATPNTYFQDAPHYPWGLVPGDGVHVIWPLLLGINRARYFLLTGQKIQAEEALALGVINEIVEPQEIMDRARTLARQLLQKPPMTVRLSRVAITHQLRREMLNGLDIGLALEGLAATEYWPPETHD